MQYQLVFVMIYSAWAWFDNSFDLAYLLDSKIGLRLCEDLPERAGPEGQVV